MSSLSILAETVVETVVMMVQSEDSVHVFVFVNGPGTETEAETRTKRKQNFVCFLFCSEE
jgi:hypothetical protein